MRLMKIFSTKIRRICLVPYVLCLICVLGTQNANAQTNMPNIGEFGMWNTEENRNALLPVLRGDVEGLDSGFSNRVLMNDFVPIEAKVGRAMIGGFTRVAEIINRSLGGFVSVLLLVLFAFWIMLESHNVATTGGDVRKLAYEIARKGMWIAIWFIILNNNPAQLFMLIASPIIAAGTVISDTILNAVTSAAGISLPDTCAAIHEYTAANPIKGALISPAATADMLCIPTRLTGFFWTCVAAGFQWMKAGIGNSALTFFAGAIFVVMFLRNVWLFAVEALGVMASLFLAVMLLPFTAIAECFGGKTNSNDYGLFSNFFDMLTKMLGGQMKLHAQFMTFINAAIYYVALSVVAGIGLALLSIVAGTNFAENVPTVTQNTDFMMILIVGALVSHLAKKAGDVTKSLGGVIESEFGKQAGRDISGIFRNTVGTGRAWWKAIRAK